MIELMERPAAVKDLTAEIARLKCQLANMPDTTTLALAEWFGLRPAPAKIVAALLRADGRTVSAQKLIGVLGGGRRQTTKEAVMKHVSEARAGLGVAQIMTVKGLGYRLSSSALAECRRVIDVR